MQLPRLPVDLGIIVVGPVRKDIMGVAGQNNVNPVDRRNVIGRVFHTLRPRGRVDACVTECDNDIGSLCAHLWHHILRGFHDVSGDQMPVQKGLVPVNDLRGHKAHDPKAQGAAMPVRAHHITGGDSVGGCERGGVGPQKVGVQYGEARAIVLSRNGSP